MTLWPLKFFLVWRNSHRLHINNATWHVQHIFWEDIKTPTVKPYLKLGGRGTAQHPSSMRIKINEFASLWMIWPEPPTSWKKINFIYDMGSECRMTKGPRPGTSNQTKALHRPGLWMRNCEGLGSYINFLSAHSEFSYRRGN